VRIQGLGPLEKIRMTKEQILGIIKELLDSDLELDFLLRLDEEELERLTACIRNRLDQGSEE